MARQLAAPSGHNRLYWAYLLAVTTLAAAVLAFAGRLPAGYPATLAALTAFTFLASFYSGVFQTPKGSVSITLAVYTAMIPIWGASLAAWSAGLGAALAVTLLTRDVRRSLFNGARAALTVGLAAAVYLWLGGTVGQLDLSEDWLPLLIASLTRVVASEVLVAIHARTAAGVEPLVPWASPKMARSLFTSYILMTSMGALAALVYIVQPVATLLFLLPALGLHLLFVEEAAREEANRRLQEQSENLEQIVRERTREIAETANQLRRRLEESATLQGATAALVQQLDLQILLESIARESAKVTGADTSFVALLTADRSRQLIRATWGEPMAPYLGAELSLDDTLAGLVIRTGQVLVSNDAQHDRRMHPTIVPQAGLAAVVEAPIRIGDEVFGVLGIASTRPKVFDEDDMNLLASLGHMAAIAIHNAELYEKAGEVAVFEERTRIARELHDSVTQSLFSIVLNAEALRKHMAAGNFDRAEDLARKVGEIGQEALAEMRSLIFELRPQALTEKGLAFALQNHAGLFQRRHGIQVVLSVPPNLGLPPPVEAGFYRIAQEALANVVKHARATQVEVTCTAADGVATLVISDNGVGFDLAAVAQRETITFGLTGMRERLAALGGRLSVESRPGGGTRLEARVPLERGAQASSPERSK